MVGLDEWARRILFGEHLAEERIGFGFFVALVGKDLFFEKRARLPQGVVGRGGLHLVQLRGQIRQPPDRRS